MEAPKEETLDSLYPNDVSALPAEAVRWRCDPSTLPFNSTKDVEPMVGVVGQDDAIEALRFGLETNAPVARRQNLDDLVVARLELPGIPCSLLGELMLVLNDGERSRNRSGLSVSTMNHRLSREVAY